MVLKPTAVLLLSLALACAQHDAPRVDSPAARAAAVAPSAERPAIASG
jgi:hypothetical protein